jgi:lipid A 3-O-deacylase
MRHFNLVTLAALAVCATALSTPAQASPYFTGHVGWFDFIDEEEESIEFGAEYRFNPIDYGFRPTLGLSVNTDGGVYGYGGFNWDVPLIDNQLYLIPNFMVGAYGQGDSKDLGDGIEFRSGIEMSYQLPNSHRIGVAINHISNAGLGDKNPGAETLLMNYSVPVGNLF